MADTINADVVIIGAGLAGLAAAHVLAIAGCRIAVLDARNRIGGRAYTIAIGGLMIDLGGQWLAPSMRRMHALAQAFGVAITKTPTIGNKVFVFDGKRRLSSELPPISCLALLDLLLFQARSNRLIEGIPAVAPWTSNRALQLDRTTLGDWVARGTWTSGARNYLSSISEEGLCVSSSEVSLLEVGWQIKTMGGSLAMLDTAEDSFLAGGSGQIAAGLAAPFHDYIYLGQAARRIEHGSDSVRVVSDKANYLGRRVIVAIPPTLANRIEYVPLLPASRDQLTQRLGQGSVIKVIAIYSEPFWRKEGLSGSAYSDTGPVKRALDCSPVSGPGVIVGLLSGSDARRWSPCPADERRAAVLRQLSLYYGDQASKPLDYVEKDWSMDPWSRGGYGMHFPPGVLTQFGPSAWAPVGCIHWAGAELATEWRLYMEGALQSGEGAAAAVLASL